MVKSPTCCCAVGLGHIPGPSFPGFKGIPQHLSVGDPSRFRNGVVHHIVKARHRVGPLVIFGAVLGYGPCREDPKQQEYKSLHNNCFLIFWQDSIFGYFLFSKWNKWLLLSKKLKNDSFDF